MKNQKEPTIYARLHNLTVIFSGGARRAERRGTRMRIRPVRFRLRSIFVLTLCVAVWACWYAHRREINARRAEAYHVILARGGHFSSGFYEVHFHDPASPVNVAHLTDEQLSPVIDALAKCDAPRYLDLSDTQITDASLAQIPKLRRLRHLNLDRTAVTDDGLRHLRNGPMLYEIHLTGTNVTSAGMKWLAGQSKLLGISVNANRLSHESV